MTGSCGPLILLSPLLIQHFHYRLCDFISVNGLMAGRRGEDKGDAYSLVRQKFLSHLLPRGKKDQAAFAGPEDTRKTGLQ